MHTTQFEHRRHVSGHLFRRDANDAPVTRTDCEPRDPLNTLTDRLNMLLNSSGPGYVLPLCPDTRYELYAPVRFAAPAQEISTVGLPRGAARATLAVAGPVANGTGHTTAVDGTCADCAGVRLRYVQVDGTRRGAPPTRGGANIEMGGANAGQVVEHVRSFDPRGWSCLHVAEGAGLACVGAEVRDNEIGPCGSDAFEEWADGISFSCRDGRVEGNTVRDATDGGIVLFGAPGTVVEGNTISVENSTLLGGINMVDYDPWSGNYTGTIVRNNTILGGFADSRPQGSETKGTNDKSAIIKIGIAIGPRTWFGDRYGNNVSYGGSVLDNRLSGAFAYGIALSSARAFIVQGNAVAGNASFVGARGPNCTQADDPPPPAPFVQDARSVANSAAQADFAEVRDGDDLICVVPPDGGAHWPFSGGPGPGLGGAQAPSGAPHRGLSAGGKAGIAVGVVLGLAVIAAAVYAIRRAALARLGNATAGQTIASRYTAGPEARWRGSAFVRRATHAA